MRVKPLIRPFWEGENLWVSSIQSEDFCQIPSTGLPEYFDSVQSYDNYVRDTNQN